MMQKAEKENNPIAGKKSILRPAGSVSKAEGKVSWGELFCRVATGDNASRMRSLILNGSSSRAQTCG